MTTTNTINNNNGATFTFKSGITRSGVFHADEVFATAFIRKLNPDFIVTRTFKVPAEVPEGTLIYDIGGGQYDHHQKGGNGARENGIPYASFGLLWREFGKLVVLNDEVWKMVDRDLVSVVDGFDNGYVKVESNLPAGVLPVNTLISRFNPTWDSDASSDERFEEAVKFAATILDNTIKNCTAKWGAKEIVDKAIAASIEVRSGKVVYLPDAIPWQEHLLGNEQADGILYVVYQTRRNDYACQVVPDKLGLFGMRKPLPESWRGAPKEKLREITGVEDAEFCHTTGFMCTALSLHGASALAELAVSAEG